jgi:hypothetical protein
VAFAGTAQWHRLGVPAETPTFVDMRSITTGWECQRRGIDPLPRNPCDPWAVSRDDPRPASRPRLWQLPGNLGLDESSTVPLAIANAFLFFAAVLWFIGPLRLWETLVVSLALCSPAVMFGVERGNVDLVSIAVLAAALVLLHRTGTSSRLVAHGLFLLAGVMKIFPSFSFVVLARQQGRWRLAAAAVAGLFALYIALTLNDILTLRRVYPQEISLAYGAGVLADAMTIWLDSHTGWPGERANQIGGLFSKAIVALGVVAAIPIGLRWRQRYAQRERTVRFDGFLAGAAMYVGTYILLHEYDYRLTCLVLVLPRLLWACDKRDAWPFARVALANVLLVLLLAARTPGWPPFEEAFNWLLFVYFAAALVAIAAAAMPRDARSQLTPGATSSKASI